MLLLLHQTALRSRALSGLITASRKSADLNYGTTQAIHTRRRAPEGPSRILETRFCPREFARSRAGNRREQIGALCGVREQGKARPGMSPILYQSTGRRTLRRAWDSLVE